MRDYLVNTDIEFTLGMWSDFIPTGAIETEWTETTPQVLIPGNWKIVTIATEKGESLPAELEEFVVAENEREEGLLLPEGMVNLTVVFGGMTLRTQ